MFRLKNKLALALVLSVMLVVGMVLFATIIQSRLVKDFFSMRKQYKLVIPLNQDFGNMSTDIIKDGLPGQPPHTNFQQYSGYVTVDEPKGRSLFYYFVEAAVPNPRSKPVILWLNGGPGCSSLNGAFLENGPFQVRNDGTPLFLRRYSWNKVANMLYLESPAGVGFSYSNTTSDYNSCGDLRTAEDSLLFLINWFQRFSPYKSCDFYIGGESYAGFYIPELAQLIIQNRKHSQVLSTIQFRGIMVGNALINFETDIRGLFDYIWTHSLISDETHQGLIKNCMGSIVSECLMYQAKAAKEMQTPNVYNLYSPACNTTIKDQEFSGIDPCERNYLSVYMNLPHVQKAMHANTTSLPYVWGPCSSVLNGWGDRPSTMFPLYKKLIAAGIHILVYSGDVDAVLPVTGTRYSLNALKLPIKRSWHAWFDDSEQVAGYKVEFEGLTFMTVLGAGHEVPRFQPRKAFSLIKIFLERIKT